MEKHLLLMLYQSKWWFKSEIEIRSRVKGREGMFQSAEEIEKIEPRLYKPPVSA